MSSISPCSRWLNQFMYSATATAISRSSSRAAVADELGLEQRDERLGRGVVVGVAGAAHGSRGGGVGETLGVAHGEVLGDPLPSGERARRGPRRPAGGSRCPSPVRPGPGRCPTSGTAVSPPPGGKHVD